MAVKGFKEHIDLYAENKDAIISLWVNDTMLQEILAKHSISPSYFANDFAMVILEYFINMIKGDVSIDDPTRWIRC